MNNQQVNFFDVTLRDGNQALRRPWNLEQKLQVFEGLVSLGVQGVEAGFAAASQSDFEAISRISRQCPPDMVLSSLSRAVTEEIEASWQALQAATRPRIHIVYPVSAAVLQGVFNTPVSKAVEKVRAAVGLARRLADRGGAGASVQFSGEHLGDCITLQGNRLEAAIPVFRAAVEAGADVINLPNTVEKYRPALFTAMIKEVIAALPAGTTISVHNHNDLGMGVATTVESFFSGASQLEVSINGLGERAGNTSLVETACALRNCGIDVPLNFDQMYRVSQLVARLSGVPVHEKMPIVGADITSHRSGIHQDVVVKTSNGSAGAGVYRPMDLSAVGRPDNDRIGFTSQSGKSAVMSILAAEGIMISAEEARALQPVLKKKSEDHVNGELSPAELVEVYEAMAGSLQGSTAGG